MGDYEVHRLVVRAEDDLVGILNNIGSNTEVILREGTHDVASQIVLAENTAGVAYGVDQFTATDQITLDAGEGDVTAAFFIGREFTIAGSTSNNGVFTVESSTFGTNTVITTAEKTVVNEGPGSSATATTADIGLENVTIRGSTASILNITYSGDNPIAITAPASDITFEGFAVEYNGSAGGQTPLFAPIGSGGATIKNLVVRNIHAVFNSGAITFVRADGEDIDVHGLTIEVCTLSGVDTKGLFRWPIAANRELTQVRILGNRSDRVVAGGSQGVALYGASGALIEDIIVSGNTINNQQESIWIVDNSGTTKKILITGNIFSFINSGNAGCYIEGSGISNVEVTDNIFDTTGASYCLSVASGSYYNISDNEFLNSPSEGLIIGSGVTDSTIDNNVAANCVDEGIEINGSDNRISNNTCEGNDYGISEGSGADGNHYVGNTCRNNATADKLLQGSGRRQGVNYW